MSKTLKNEKIYRNFIKKFKFFLKDKTIKNIPHYFDLDFKLIKYCLIIIDFIILDSIDAIKNRHNKLCFLFYNLYQNLIKIGYYEKIKNNFNFIAYDQTKFNNFAINFCLLFDQRIKNKKIFIDLIVCGLNYFFLNIIDCKITLNPMENSKSKINFVIFITKQFAKLKAIILKTFKNEANKLIILLIGMSKRMN